MPLSRPYPWYEINGLTRDLEPYAHYSASRVHFERCYQPETDQPLFSNGNLDIEALRRSFQGDEERYGWISGDPIMKEIAAMLWGDPAALINRAQVNADYMSGFKNRSATDKPRSVIEQARIHMMTACLVLGETYEDDAVSKKLLRDNTLLLWAGAWFRAEALTAKRFSPTMAELEATMRKLPPCRRDKFQRDKFHWPEVFSSLGLSALPAFGKQTHKPGRRVFSWAIRP
jgi:hypothetical protein